MLPLRAQSVMGKLRALRCCGEWGVWGQEASPCPQITTRKSGPSASTGSYTLFEASYSFTLTEVSLSGRTNRLVWHFSIAFGCLRAKMGQRLLKMEKHPEAIPLTDSEVPSTLTLVGAGGRGRKRFVPNTSSLPGELKNMTDHVLCTARKGN